jgi:hypothetical protein
MTQKAIIVLLSFILVFVLIFGFIELFGNERGHSEILYGISNMGESMSNRVMSAESDIDSMKSDIENMLKKQASIISGYSISYGKPDSSTLQGSITLNVTPKEYLNGTTAKYYMNGAFNDMILNGNTFTAEIPVSIVKNYSVSVTFSANGANRTESLPEIIGYGKFLNQAFGGNEITSSEAEVNGKRIPREILSVEFHPQLGDTIDSAKLIALMDGKEAWTKDIPDPDRSGNLRVEYDRVDSESGKEYELYIDVKSSYGFTYRYRINDPKEGGLLYDKNGKEIAFEPEPAGEFDY